MLRLPSEEINGMAGLRPGHCFGEVWTFMRRRDAWLLSAIQQT